MEDDKKKYEAENVSLNDRLNTALVDNKCLSDQLNSGVQHVQQLTSAEQQRMNQQLTTEEQKTIIQGQHSLAQQLTKDGQHNLEQLTSIDQQLQARTA